MSVLKSRRQQSKVEFVNVANQIFVEVMGFLTRMSNRYQRLLAADTMKLASAVLDHCEAAQSVYIKDQVTFDIREKHLVEARASLMALDVHMSHVWRILMLNPEGCFTNTKGRMKNPNDAITILDRMAVSLGEKIDQERKLISGVMQSDKKKFTS